MSDPNVLLVVIDSLRASALGNLSDTSCLRTLARQGICFSNVYATASHSDYEDPVLISGRHQLRGVGTHECGNYDDEPLVHLVAKNAGYLTALFSSQDETWARMDRYTRLNSWDRLFHAGENGASSNGECGKYDDHVTIGEAKNWLRANKSEPFFLMLNLHNSHIPYSLTSGHPLASLPTGGIMGAQPSRIGDIVARYMASVELIDTALRSLVDLVFELGISRRTAILVTSDTGQAFLEHGHMAHGRDCHEESLRVPMILYREGGESRLVSHLVSHVDVTSIVTELMGLGVSMRHQGFGLKDILNGARQLAFSVCRTPIGAQYSVRSTSSALIYDARLDSFRFYDRSADPSEHVDLSKLNSEEQRKLWPKLRHWIAAHSGLDPTPRSSLHDSTFF